MNGKRIIAACVVTALTASAAYGQSIDPVYQQTSLYGIRLPTGSLWRYNFTNNTRVRVGFVTNVETGIPLTDIRAGAYFNKLPPNHPGFQQVHAFWLDPIDNHSKVIHVDTETAEARQTGIDLGEGLVRGAEAVVNEITVTNPDGTTYPQKTWRVFAVQDVPEPESPPAVDGMANLNPNNSPQWQFNMVTPGQTYTRDDLHMAAAVTEEGVLYQGSASVVFFSPKGNGNQNSIILNGEPFLLNNGKEYEFSGSLTVKVFNDHIKNTKAMGDWWIGIDAETATVKEDGVVIISPPEPWVPTSRLVSLHTETGLGTTILELSRQYSALASNDNGATFYALSGGNLYRINPATKTETLIGSTSMGDTLNVTDMEFIGTTLYAFDTAPDKVFPLSTVTGAKITTGANIGISELGAMVSIPNSEVPTKSYAAFD